MTRGMGSAFLARVGGMKYSGVERAACSPQAESKLVVASRNRASRFLDRLFVFQRQLHFFIFFFDNDLFDIFFNIIFNIFDFFNDLTRYGLIA